MADSIIESRGSSIDQEIDGPIPPNQDTRPRDVLQEQEDKQRGRQAVGESIIDAPSPPPQEAFDVAPPPPMPSLFGGMQSVYDIAKEAASDVFRDNIKNLSINGVTPDISGGDISFRIPTEPSASSSFASMNGLDINTSAQEIAIPPPSSQQASPSQQYQLSEKQQIENIQGQVAETQASSLKPPASDPSVPEETKVADSVKVSVMESDSEENARQRSWSNYEGNKPIESRVETGFYGASETHGPRLETTGGETSDGRDMQQQQQQAMVLDTRTGEKTPVPQNVSEKIKSLLDIAPDIHDMTANNEKAKDYANTNDPFAQYIFFDVCTNGQPRKFLIPAFGPYNP